MTKRTRVWRGEDRVELSIRALIYPLLMVAVAIVGAASILWYALTHG